MKAGSVSERTVEIALLGGAKVRLLGEVTPSVAVIGRAAVVLAALALADGGVLGRELLADGVWGERPPNSWRAALRNVIAELRGVLAQAGAPEALQTVGEGYRLVLPQGSSVDLLELDHEVQAAKRALAAGDTAGALAGAAQWLERSPGEVLPDARSEWVDRLRQRASGLREALALTASRAAFELGDSAEAERLAWMVIEASPLREEGHGLLVCALAAGGNRTAAVAAYERFSNLLERELGMRPSEETQRLAQQVLAQALPTAAPLGSAKAIVEWQRSADYGLRVGRAALSAGEFEDVIAVARRTLQALKAAGEPDAVRQLDLLILLGAAQRALGGQEGFATLDAAVAAARELGDGGRLADAVLAFTHGGAAADEHYVDHTLSELYEEALDAIGQRDPRRRAPLLGHLAVAHAFARGGAGVSSSVGEALALAREERDKRTLLATLTLARRAIWGHFQVDEQERLEQEILELAIHLDDPGAHASALLWRFMTRLEQGHGEELETLLEAAEPVVSGRRMGHYHHTLAYSRAALAILRGELVRGEELIEQAAEIGRRRGLEASITEALRLAQLVGLRHEQGRLKELREQAIGLYGSAGEPLWLGMVAVVEAATGSSEASARALSEFLETYQQRGPTLLAPVGLAAYAAYPVVATGERTHAEQLYKLLGPHIGRGCYFAYFAGPIDLHLGLLADALGRPADAKRHFQEAVAFCERIGAPLWTERCLQLAIRSG